MCESIPGATDRRAMPLIQGPAPQVTVLAGGFGAARLLEGLVGVCDPPSITAVVNCGDDMVHCGLHISPDIDTIIYRLAGQLNPETGWGLRDESWRTLEALRRLGGPDWFGLGDRDLGTHLYRTERLAAGAPLSQVTAELCERWGVAVRILPVTDDRLRTRVTVDRGSGPCEVSFQKYFVGLGGSVKVVSVRYAGAAVARPAPGVAAAIAEAQRLIIAPSNPIVSIAPLLAPTAVRRAVEARRADTVAISPIVAGKALRGPAARLMSDLGHEPSAAGVAGLYAPLAATLVIDETDARLTEAINAAGMRCVVTNTVMDTPAEAEALARVVLTAAGH